MITKVKSKKVKISSKGQITLPKSFLEELDLDSDQFIQIVVNNHKIEITNSKESIKDKLKKLVNSVEPKIPTNLSIEDQIDQAKQDYFGNKNL
jgi:bifunctional DNA-binding transcriptional regulator/antitoxin component of YhaV-PrlF toxin-antitoxin module